MLECVSFKSSTPTTNSSPLPPPSHSHSEGNSAEEFEEDTSATSPNVSGEFHRALEAHSYNEIRSMVQAPPQVHHIDDEDSHHRHVLSQVLQPDSHSVHEALAKAKPKSNLTRLVSTYFYHSETASDFCLRLSRSVHRARHLYAPLSDLLAVLPASAPPLSQPQCDRAYELFLQFDREENPFALSRLHRLRDDFSDLKRDIQRDLRKCHSRIRLFRHSAAGCALCFVAVAAGTVVVASIVFVHAVVGFSALSAAPFCVTRQKRRELARLKQLEAVENGTLVVNDINTIDSLVDRLQTAVEGDKAFVRFALDRGRERHPIQEVLNQLRKNQPVLEHLLGDLEQHIYFCFYSVNMARYALLKAICSHQTP
ncbi:hypothetical protein AAZX31_19G092900 [Glycine max]|uniref:Uncharacterized protein n=1 Tax=Glycine max TaxID=3847 RepID=K7MXN9_SOYBN|nr:UPF0496 protein At3g19330 [Glycine max]KAG5083053.1 hypothetical protein JHK84_053091 [Glycine max]KAG5085823.1 hypothetical protein JHK82_053220 [Glycine max]KAH1077211.1 hypothetical protein GYH30_052640 [Glycine max]KRG94722.1 hypothetical protein GLYMA_19G104500v4 [Glycine max]|eukprot:XP_006604203.1 UPF0496 protein At3g19330 [Glycine max]